MSQDNVIEFPRVDNPLNLPVLEEQNIKFCHLRYKIVPKLDTFHTDSDLEDFFSDVGLPTCEAYSLEREDFVKTALYPNGGITAAFKIDPATAVAEVGISKCSILDPYNKIYGRRIASGRFEKMVDNHHNRFETCYQLELEESLKEDIEDLPPSAHVRNHIVAEANDGTLQDVERDLATIRAMVAYRTKIPFTVELS